MSNPGCSSNSNLHNSDAPDPDVPNPSNAGRTGTVASPVMDVFGGMTILGN